MRVIAGNRPLDIRSSALRHGIMFKIKDPINMEVHVIIFLMNRAPSLPPPCIVATASRINRCVSGSFQRYLKLDFFVNGKSIKASNVKYDYGTREEAMETLRRFMESPYKVGIKPVFRRRGIADSGVCAKVVWFPTSWRDGATIAVDSRSLHSRSCYVRPSKVEETELPAMKTSRKNACTFEKTIGNR